MPDRLRRAVVSPGWREAVTMLHKWPYDAKDSTFRSGGEVVHSPPPSPAAAAGVAPPLIRRNPRCLGNFILDDEDIRNNTAYSCLVGACMSRTHHTHDSRGYLVVGRRQVSQESSRLRVLMFLWLKEAYMTRSLERHNRGPCTEVHNVLMTREPYVSRSRSRERKGRPTSGDGPEFRYDCAPPPLSRPQRQPGNVSPHNELAATRCMMGASSAEQSRRCSDSPAKCAVPDERLLTKTLYTIGTCNEWLRS